MASIRPAAYKFYKDVYTFQFIVTSIAELYMTTTVSENKYNEEDAETNVKSETKSEKSDLENEEESDTVEQSETQKLKTRNSNL